MKGLISIYPTPTNVTFQEVPDWRRADLEGLRGGLGGIVWENRVSNMDAVTTWETIKGIIYESDSKCVPKKRRRVANRPLCMQQNVMRIIRKKRRLWKV